MTNQSTVDKLLEMRLTSMSDAFITQLDDPRMKEIPFEDRFGMLVDAEYTNRKNNGLKRLIRGANFDQPEAHIADINYTSGRKLNRVYDEYHFHLSVNSQGQAYVVYEDEHSEKESE